MDSSLPKASWRLIDHAVLLSLAPARAVATETEVPRLRTRIRKLGSAVARQRFRRAASSRTEPIAASVPSRSTNRPTASTSGLWKRSGTAAAKFLHCDSTNQPNLCRAAPVVAPSTLDDYTRASVPSPTARRARHKCGDRFVTNRAGLPHTRIRPRPWREVTFNRRPPRPVSVWKLDVFERRHVDPLRLQSILADASVGSESQN